MRDNQAKAGEQPAGPGRLRLGPLSFPGSFFCLVMPSKTFFDTRMRSRWARCAGQAGGLTSPRTYRRRQADNSCR